MRNLISSEGGLDAIGAAATDDITVSSVSTLEEIGSINWHDLWRRAAAPSVFSRYEWLHAWWRTFREGREMRVYLAHRRGRLAGVLPTCTNPGPDGGRHHESVLVGDEHADYGAILLEAGDDAVLPRLVRASTHNGLGASRLRLRDIRSDTRPAQLLDDWLASWGARWVKAGTTPCPRLDLARTSADKILLKSSIRRSESRLASLGQVRCTHLTDPDQIAERLDEFFLQHIRRWASTPWPSLFTRKSNQAFYRELAARLAPTGALVFSELKVGQHPVAFHFGFISEDDLVWYKPSFDPGLAHASPGQALIGRLCQYAIDHGLGGIDFTRGAEPFKYRFANEERQALTFEYYPSRTRAMMLRSGKAARRILKHGLSQVQRRPGP